MCIRDRNNTVVEVTPENFDNVAIAQNHVSKISLKYKCIDSQESTIVKVKFTLKPGQQEYSFRFIKDCGKNNFSLSTVLIYLLGFCLLYTSPSPRDRQKSRMPSSA
eukprot:TRINITY_DN14376_c0_g1_i1.p1 TRINITY_DN14376_c0_g1~~TRINITY_DN14376_c0_g1_i1.p1  ORF type:complete len:106 (-),score=29.39 TRINITY_DN14376_c0_g1_i1:21-338(-)